MRLHILSEFRIEALEEAHLAEFIVEDLILALQCNSSRIVGDDIVADVQRENKHLIYHYDLELARHRVSAQFISEYLAKLGREGKVEGQEDICAAIRQDISDIDQLIRQAEQAQERKKMLIMLLENMGDTSYRRQRIASGAPLDVEDSSESAKQVQLQVVQLFREHDGLTNNEIRTKTGCTNDRLVIRAIKRLGELGILDRDRSTNELKIIRGMEFDRAEELLGAT
jgi:hypothetical protein